MGGGAARVSIEIRRRATVSSVPDRHWHANRNLNAFISEVITNLCIQHRGSCTRCIGSCDWRSWRGMRLLPSSGPYAECGADMSCCSLQSQTGTSGKMVIAALTQNSRSDECKIAGDITVIKRTKR